MVFRPASSLCLVVITLTFATLGACSGQGEGQLCNRNAGHGGTDDCQSGLVCAMSPPDRCCPPDRSKATTATCSLNSGGLDASPAPPDGSAEASSTDAAGDDSSVDSALDAALGNAAETATIDASDAAPAFEAMDAANDATTE